MKRQTLFRKLATSLWSDLGDPSVYGWVEVDVTDLKDSSCILAKIIQALGRTMSLNPEMTTCLRWGRVHQRNDQVISVMVNIQNQNRDLSILNLDMKNDPSLTDIQEQIEKKSVLVRNRQDPHLGRLLSLARIIPHSLLRIFLKAYTSLIYEWNLRTEIFSIPQRPFGSVIVSNIGSLGLQKALLPLVPLTRACMMISVGKASPEVKFYNHEVCVRQIVHLGVTFDHRLFDGAHAAKMLKDFHESFQVAVGTL